MSQGTLNTILSGIAAFGGFAAAIVGGVAIWIAVRHNRQRRREREEDRRLTEEQLNLARQEALRHPNLEVVGISLVDAEEVEDVVRTREAKEKWREALERAQDEDIESSTSRGEFKPFGEAMEKLEKAAKLSKGYSIGQIMYDGPYPEMVLTFELRNMGRRAAKEVSGSVAVERSFLEPINFPHFDGEVFEGREFSPPPRKKAELKIDKVPPFPSEDSFIFRIALLKKRPGKTTIIVTFSTPEGDYLEERIPLEVP